jgi:acyl transferase domain-containing protein
MVAMQMLRRGMARRVLAGGADCLCRLTCFGFKSLQLIDPMGARPLDRQRRGMSVAEGAALLLLTSEPPGDAAVQVVGAGISCDAHHATTPHPDGEGAAAAMRAALDDAGLAPQAIDYINLHGTGTRDNDLAEARAIRALFPSGQPLLSSIKGATGHSLAAAGAIEAVIAALCIQHGLVPANVGYRTCDPDLGLEPVSTPRQLPISTVMSNSFGFGGNNASLILRRSPDAQAAANPETVSPPQGRRHQGLCAWTASRALPGRATPAKPATGFSPADRAPDVWSKAGWPRGWRPARSGVSNAWRGWPWPWRSMPAGRFRPTGCLSP